MTPWFGDRPVLILFVVPVILSAYVGGLGPGLVATAISALGTAFFVMPPEHIFAFAKPADRAQWLIFILVCVLMSVVTEALLRSRQDTSESVAIGGGSQQTEVKVRVGFAFALACLAGIGVISFLSLETQTEHTEKNLHTERIIDSLHRVLSAATDAETAERGFVITGNRDFLEPYEESRSIVDAAFRDLRQLMANNGTQQKRLDDLTRLLNQRLALIDTNIERRDREGFEAAQAAIATGGGKLIHDSIREILVLMERTEDGLMEDRMTHAKRNALFTRGVIIVGNALAFSVVLVALFIIGSDFSRSRKAEADLIEARDQLETRVVERTAQLEKSNDTLKASEARYRDLVQLSPHAMFLNEDNRITFINDAGLRLFGAANAGEMLGRSLMELTHPDYHPVVRERIARLLEAPQSVPYALRKMIRLDGSLIDAEVAAASYWRDDKMVLQVVIQDITERTRAEMMTARLATIVESSDDAIIGKTIKGIITSWNRGAEATFGYTAAEAVGQTMRMIIPSERLEEETETLKRIGRGENVKHFDTVRLRKDGRRIHVSVTISPIWNPAGEIIGASKIARDITERVRLETALRVSEGRLRTLIDLIPDPIYMKDRERRFVLANATTARLLGAASAADLLGRTDADFFPAEKAAGFQADEEQVYRGVPLINREEYLTDSTGQKYTVLTTKIPLLDDGGEMVGLVGIGHDITKRKQMEMVLAASEKRFRTTLDNLMEGCHIIGRDWRYLYINKAAAGHNRRPAATMIGLTLMECFPGIEASDLFTRMQNCMNDDAVHDIEKEWAYPDGSKTWFHLIIQSVPEGVFILSTDITARKEAEVLLRRQAEELRILFDLIPAMIWFKDTNNRHLRVNQRVADALGLPVSEIEGRPCSDVYPEEADRFYADDLEVIRSGKPKLGIIEKVHDTTGAVHWIQTDKVPYHDENGRVVGIVVAAQDITGRREAEAALKFHEALLRETGHIAKVGGWSFDPATGDGYWTEEVARIHELEPTDTTSMRNGLSFYQGESRRLIEAAIKTAVESGVSYDLELNLITMKGRSKWIRTIGHPQVEGGKVVRVQGSFQDITDRKLTERRLATQGAVSRVLSTAESMEEATPLILAAICEAENWEFGALWYLDEENAVLRCQDFWRGPILPLDEFEAQTRSIVFARGQGLPGRVWASGSPLLSPDLSQDDNYPCRPLAIKAGFRSGLGFPIYQGSKVTGVIDFLSTESREPDSKLEEVFGLIGRQIGLFIQRRQAQEQVLVLNAELEMRVKERTAQLESANKELEAFSYSVSHDLRAPLRAVDGFSQALVEDYGALLPAEGCGFLATIRGETQRMGELIDDLLTFSRLSRASLDRLPIDSDALVRSIVHELVEEYPSRKFDVCIENLPDCEGDLSLMRQVWINLLSNAVKYTGRKDRARIEVGSRQEGDELIYFVRDNGAGFDMRYIGKLFGVFQRLHRSEEYEGTGVGLAIVQRIVHRHGGRVWGEGVVDEGATFYFSLKQETHS
jgi:PAS domain S-box-containing protein